MADCILIEEFRFFVCVCFFVFFLQDPRKSRQRVDCLLSVL